MGNAWDECYHSGRNQCCTDANVSVLAASSSNLNCDLAVDNRASHLATMPDAHFSLAPHRARCQVVRGEQSPTATLRKKTREQSEEEAYNDSASGHSTEQSSPHHITH